MRVLEFTNGYCTWTKWFEIREEFIVCANSSTYNWCCLWEAIQKVQDSNRAKENQIPNPFRSFFFFFYTNSSVCEDFWIVTWSRTLCLLEIQDFLIENYSLILLMGKRKRWHRREEDLQTPRFCQDWKNLVIQRELIWDNIDHYLKFLFQLREFPLHF